MYRADITDTVTTSLRLLNYYNDPLATSQSATRSYIAVNIIRMSRRASFFARHHPGERRVRFPDEIVFDDCVKESEEEMVVMMLRRVSLEIDVNRINMAGTTALHQAVLDDNLLLVRVLLNHGADINKADVDSWTPLHAAAANGHSDLVRYLTEAGAATQILTEDGETALDLVDSDDLETMAVLLNTKVDKLKKKTSGSEGSVKLEPAWVRKESVQEQLEKKKIPVIAKKCNEISDGNKVKIKENEASAANDQVKPENILPERKRRIGQSDPLIKSVVNAKVCPSNHSKDRI